MLLKDHISVAGKQFTHAHSHKHQGDFRQRVQEEGTEEKGSEIASRSV